jgi:hypothetical protein
MMRIRVVGTALLFLCLGVFGPAFGQPEDHRQADQQKGNEQRARGREQSRSGGQATTPRREGARQQVAPSPAQRGGGQGRVRQTAPPRQGQNPQGQQAQPRAGGRRAEGSQVAPPQQARQGYARGTQGPYPRSLRTEQQARAWQQQRTWAGRGGWQGQSTWDQQRARRWQVEHRTWSQRGGYGGFVVPAERFHVLFGSQHWFRIYTRPVIVDGYPRFWYGGYWWMIVDPWPEFWSDNWYDTDDVYIDYSDGYYLYDRRHPGVGLAVTVAF